MKKLWKPIAAIVLALSLASAPAVHFAQSMTAVEAAAKPKLSKTRLTLQIGATAKLKVKNSSGTWKWSSSNKNIAAVKKGKVTAKNPGRVKIKAQKGNQTLVCKVTVKTDEETVLNNILAMQDTYPQGMPWDNSKKYKWTITEVKDGQTHTTIYNLSGCAALASILSDAGFGKWADIKKITNPDAAEIRIGDIIRFNNNSHSAVVIGIDSDSLTIVEGNYNASVNWGRQIPKDTRIDYIWTRW